MIPTRNALFAMLAGGAMLLSACSDLSAGADSFGVQPRPRFQMPMACGQVHEASTYDEPGKHHWPDADSIDLAQRDAVGDNITLGEPVLASAAGTVSEVYTTESGEHRVFLDHGNGWSTYYIHLDTLPDLEVGRRVAQGEVIGRNGKSGSEAVHLHYTQTLDEEALRVEFDGVPIDTHEGNPDSYGTWGTDDAEEIMSLNCAGNTFMGWSDNGDRYVLIYKPGNGDVKIVRVDDDGTGVTTTWDGNWGFGWTHFMPFYAGLNGHPHALVYKSSTGEAQFHRLNLGGDGVTQLSTHAWYAGWTHLAPFRYEGSPHLLAYDSLNGYANIDRIVATSDGTTTLSSETWLTGRTAIVPYEMGPDVYLLLYEGGTGDAKITEIVGSGDDLDTATAWSGSWEPGWSTLVPLSHEGGRYVLAYDAASGDAATMQLQAGGQGAVTTATMKWTQTWTAFAPFLTDAGAHQRQAHVLVYRTGTGDARTIRLAADASGFATVWTDGWTTGWR